MSAKTVYEKLMKVFNNPYGVCGLMGNLYAESGMKSNNLQNTYQLKFGVTDESYTKAVDDGSYKDFVHDKAGYGLAQWTYYSRKQSLLDYAKSVGKSIGDEDMQIDFLIKEIKGYSNVYNTLLNATSVRQASDVVLTQYEKPADQSEYVKSKRTTYGQTYYNDFCAKKPSTNNGYVRQKVIDLINSWEGKKESDGSFKEIIDIYNSLPTSKLPRNTKMQYGWEWCACVWSALAIKLGYTEIMPIEISCYYLIESAKKMNVWVEGDSYVPKAGDAVLYDWQDIGNGDNVGVPDHIGTVVEVYESAGYMVVMEGNYEESVKKRTVSLNGKYIRGYITPKYTNNAIALPVQASKKDTETIAREVVVGKWGSGDTRKTALTKAGYDYEVIQARVNEIVNGSANTPSSSTQSQSQKITNRVVSTCSAKYHDSRLAGTYKTTADLYIRNDAGTNKKALAIIPKGTPVNMYGYYNKSNNVDWYYVQVVIDKVQYTGFCSSAYLVK